jgi:hypothetical protein
MLETIDLDNRIHNFIERKSKQFPELHLEDSIYDREGRTKKHSKKDEKIIFKPLIRLN